MNIDDHAIEERLNRMDLLPQLRAFLRKYPELILEPNEARLFNEWFARYRLRDAMSRTQPEHN